MLDIKTDISGARKKLRELVKKIGDAEGSGCTIKATKVLNYLGDQLGRNTIASLPDKEWKKLDALVAPKVGKAMMKADAGLVAKAYRYWAYKYIEALWEQAKGKLWGTVAPSTLEHKKRGNPSKRKKRRGRPSTTKGKAGRLGGHGKGIPPDAYGVRHKPAWHAVQKHKKKIGGHDLRSHLMESEPLIESTYRNRVIARR